MSKFDASIPVLTEVFLDQPAQPVATSPAAADGAAASGADAPDLCAASPSAAAAPDWAALERQVSQRVLQQLSARVDFVLEQRIKDSMEEVLTHALRGLTDEIRAGLHDTIGTIVTRAVQQEITHLQASAPEQDDKR
jgi:hypothetical protein